MSTETHTHSRSTDNTQFQLGQNSQAITTLLAGQLRIEGDIAYIKATLATQKGERRVAVWAAGGVGSLMMFLLAIIGRKLGF